MSAWIETERSAYGPCYAISRTLMSAWIETMASFFAATEAEVALS